MSEFDLIRRLQEIISVPQAAYASQVALGIGDDAAVLDAPPGRQLVVCTDTLVEGVHFFESTAAASVGHKALAVNLSDLAAMGAEPAWFFLALTLPAADPDWLEPFAQSMARLASEASICLAGGDLTSGPLNVCITAVGLVEPGAALTRSGAAIGDRVVVSGYPGAAARALEALASGGIPDDRDRAALEFPEPRLALGRTLRGVATACVDLSDGLLADLGHILESSGHGAELELHRLPCPESMSAVPDRKRWHWQLNGGDDYELCFTVPPQHAGLLEQLAAEAGVPLTAIGTVTKRPGVVIHAPDGSRYRPDREGYDHFRNQGPARP